MLRAGSPVIFNRKGCKGFARDALVFFTQRRKAAKVCFLVNAFL